MVWWLMRRLLDKVDPFIRIAFKRERCETLYSKAENRRLHGSLHDRSTKSLNLIWMRFSFIEFNRITSSSSLFEKIGTFDLKLYGFTTLTFTSTILYSSKSWDDSCEKALCSNPSKSVMRILKIWGKHSPKIPWLRTIRFIHDRISNILYRQS